MRTIKEGYALVLTIMMSAVIMAVLLGVYNTVTSLYITSNENYYLKLAEEAGEAGTAYANACMDRNTNAQSWSSAAGGVGPLTPSSGCKGEANVYPGNQYVFNNGKVRTTFRVGNLDHARSDTAQISAIGRTEVVNGGVVIKSYEVTIKKSITWSNSLIAKKSMSGTFRTCAIMSKNIWCWGRNRYGQLGNGKSITAGMPGYTYGATPDVASSVDSNVPVRVKKDAMPLDAEIDDMFTAQYHTCVLVAGKVYCWGWNQDGQLGNGESGVGAHSSVPVQVKGALAGKTVTSIGGSSNTSCAIADKKIYCWGSSAYGTTGTDLSGSGTLRPWPTLVTTGGTDGLPNNYEATKLSTSGSRSENMCAIANGLAYCWGRNHVGQIGIDVVSPGYTVYRTPTRVRNLTNVTDISQDGYSYNDTSHIGYGTHVCAIASGRIYCWGGNGVGQSGATSTPVKLPWRVNLPSGAGTPEKIEIGIGHSCTLTSSKKVYCWGANEVGQLGINSTTPNKTAVPQAVYVGEGGIPADQTILDMGSGSNRGCVVVSNGRSYCWGRNTEGQVGDGTYINRFTPTESLFLRPVYNRYIY